MMGRHVRRAYIMADRKHRKSNRKILRTRCPKDPSPTKDLTP
jgi:hypothetical protein